MAKRSPDLKRRVRVYLAEHDMTQRQFAGLLDISASHFSNILAGKEHPSLRVARRLEVLIGIPAGEWAEVA